MNVAQECNCINVPGVCQIWYTESDNLVIPCMWLNEVLLPYALQSSEPLSFIEGLYDSMAYSTTTRRTAQGLVYNLALSGVFNSSDVAVVAAFSKLRNKRLFLYFRDNNGQYRFLQNALLSTNTSTGTLLGKGVTSFSFIVSQGCEHNYYTGPFTKNGDGTISL